MCIHDLTEADFTKMTEDQLWECRFELTEEISSLAREIANSQRFIFTNTDLIEQIELELEAREAKEKGQMN